MRIFTRYLLVELAKVFLTTLTALTLMMVILGVVTEAAKQGLGPAQVGRLLPYILPKALLFTIPGTILFAVSLVYGRMSSSNEIVALKSAGISPMAVLWPAFLLATLLSFFAVWLNDLAVSWGEAGMQRVVIESVEDIVYSMLDHPAHLQQQRFFDERQRCQRQEVVATHRRAPEKGKSPSAHHHGRVGGNDFRSQRNGPEDLIPQLYRARRPPTQYSGPRYVGSLDPAHERQSCRPADPGSCPHADANHSRKKSRTSNEADSLSAGTRVSRRDRFSDGRFRRADQR